MVPIQNYKKFFTEFIRKHMIIFGPNIATATAANVEGLKVDSSGEVTDIVGDWRRLEKVGALTRSMSVNLLRCRSNCAGVQGARLR